MGIKFTEVEEQQRIVLHIRNLTKHVSLGAMVKKHLRDNLSHIILDYSGTEPLIFNNVKIDVEYCQPNGVPLVWHNARIATYKNAYILQVVSEGVRNNRRNSFRVPIAQTAWAKIPGHGAHPVLVKDISLSGFSITDRKKDLGLAIGDRLSMFFDDWGYEIDLDGRVVRIQETEDMIIYGFAICNLCNDLSPYITLKQRRNRHAAIKV